jgi:hypothetical protein
MQCLRNDLELHWALYKERILDPNLESLTKPSIQELMEKYGIESPQKTSNMLVAVKRRFQNTIMRHLTNYTTSEGESKEELDYFLELFSKGKSPVHQDIDTDKHGLGKHSLNSEQDNENPDLDDQDSGLDKLRKDDQR